MPLDQDDRKYIVVGEADAPRSRRDMSVVVYDVSDLVQFAAGGNLQESIDSLQSTIAPNSWWIVGGEASVMPYGPAGVFVIRQSKNAHEAIKDTLKARRAQRRR